MALHFDFSDDQRMLAESLNRLLAGAAVGGFADIAAALSRHGMFGTMLDEDRGGLGLGLTDALALSIEIGRAGPAFPAVETMVAVPLVARMRPELLSDILAGRQIATLAAFGEANVAAERGPVRVSGEVLAPFAEKARLVVATAGEGRAVVIDLASPGVAIDAVASIDPAAPLARVRFDIVAESGAVVADDLALKAAILACGEMTGAAASCLSRSVAHLQDRVQFGKPLAANQVLRHAAADDWLRVQGMQAASEYAAAAYDCDPGNAVHAASVAKAYCSQSARKVAESAIHIHGGMGFTWDAGLHWPLRRIMRLGASYGGATSHLDFLADGLFAATSEKGKPACNSSNFASM